MNFKIKLKIVFLLPSISITEDLHYLESSAISSRESFSAVYVAQLLTIQFTIANLKL